MITITRDDWLKALDKAKTQSAAENADALTIAELADLADCSRSTIERLIPRLLKVGLVEQVKKYTRRGHSVYPTLAYRLTKDTHDRRAPRR